MLPMLTSQVLNYWWAYANSDKVGNDFSRNLTLSLTSDYHLAGFIKGVLLGRYSKLGINTSHLEIEAKYLSQRKELISWTMLSRMSPKDRRAALRMRLVTLLLNVLPQVVPSGIIIPHGKLSRLSGIASDIIMEGTYAGQESEHFNMEQKLYDIMENKRINSIMDLARNAFGSAWMKLNEQGGILSEGGAPLSSSQPRPTAAGSLSGSGSDALKKKSASSDSPSVNTPPPIIC